MQNITPFSSNRHLLNHHWDHLRNCLERTQSKTSSEEFFLGNRVEGKCGFGYRKTYRSQSLGFFCVVIHSPRQHLLETLSLVFSMFITFLFTVHFLRKFYRPTAEGFNKQKQDLFEGHKDSAHQILSLLVCLLLICQRQAGLCKDKMV